MMANVKLQRGLLLSFFTDNTQLLPGRAKSIPFCPIYTWHLNASSIWMNMLMCKSMQDALGSERIWITFGWSSVYFDRLQKVILLIFNAE